MIPAVPIKCLFVGEIGKTRLTLGRRARYRSWFGSFRAYRTSPNSRLSRPGRKPGASSHPQGRDFAMTLDDSVGCSVGIDVSKDRLDVHVLPEGLSFQVPNSPDGHHELLAR